MAVHVIGILQDRTGERNLLVDCVDQADAYYFFARREPNRALDLMQISDKLSVINNPGLVALRKIVDLEEYDNIVIDVNSPARDTVKVVLDNDPDMVLLPVNDQALGMHNLKTTVGVIAAIEQRTGYRMRSVVVPLGIDVDIIEDQLAELVSQPKNLALSGPIARHADAFAFALQSGRFVWDVDSRLKYVRDILAAALL